MSAARRAAERVVILLAEAMWMFIGVAIQLGALALCVAIFHERPAWQLAAAISGALLWFGRHRVWIAARRLLTHARLRRALQAQLRDASLLDVDPRDPRRLAHTQRFWRDAQHSALTALQAEFPTPPAPPDAARLIRRHLDKNRDKLYGVVFVCGMMGVVSVVVAVKGDLSILIAVLIALALFVVVFGVSLAILLWEAVDELYEQRDHHRAFVAEQHRIASLDELAGGLSLATDQPDDLRGALSTDAAQGGEIEEVKP